MITNNEESLTELYRQIVGWRTNRASPRAHIPINIWEEAAELSKSLGVSRVARKLGVNPTRLREKAGLKKMRSKRPRQIAAAEAKRPEMSTPTLIEVASINIPASELPEKNLRPNSVPSAVLTTASGSSLTLYQQLGISELQALISSVGGLKCSN